MQRAGEHDATGWFMRRFHGFVPHLCTAVLSLFAFLALVRPVSAAVLEQVDVREKDKGFQLRIGLAIPMGFQRVSPQGPAREFIIELLPRPTGQGIDEAAQHSQDHLSFDKKRQPIGGKNMRTGSTRRACVKSGPKQDCDFKIRNHAYRPMPAQARALLWLRPDR